MKALIKNINLVTLAMLFALPVCAVFPSQAAMEKVLLRLSIEQVHEWRQHEQSHNGILSRLSRSIDVEYAGKTAILAGAIIAWDHLLRQFSHLMGPNVREYFHRALGVGFAGLTIQEVPNFATRIYRGLSNLFASDGGRCYKQAFGVMDHFNEFQAIADDFKHGLKNNSDVAFFKRALIRKHNYLIGELEHLIGSILALQLDDDEEQAAWLCDPKNGIWTTLHNFSNHLEADLNNAESFSFSSETLTDIVAVTNEITQLKSLLELGLLNQLPGGEA